VRAGSAPGGAGKAPCDNAFAMAEPPPSTTLTTSGRSAALGSAASPPAPVAVAALDPAAATPSGRAARPSLAARVPQPAAAGGRRAVEPEEILDRFVEWTADAGFTLYRAQEEALLELAAGRHVILNTPTGSGKSLVALGLHFKALCEGRTSFYTSPIKALASEKFFSLCDDFGAANVGMLTGDAAINPRAPIVCCTAEVLANMALRRGEELDAPYVVMDEFHYYSDPERGVAWQIPLLTLPRTRFLLMSATLGDMSAIADRLRAQTGVDVALVTSAERPVPLDFEYRETPLHLTIDDLLAAGKAPIYVVNFTQRECAELAQSLTSLKIAGREERDRIREAIGGARLDTPYGKEFRRFLSFGIGVHHAGLLPKYRLLVEQLSQQGLLRVICGTDTLGVGVNIPIRTVLFSRLAKFDGKKVAMLSVRDFQQIAGRAGRKGFDEQGSVVAQAPEHIIEKRQAERRAEEGKKRRKPPGAAAAKGEVSWSRETFDKLISRPPETLKSRFRVTHGMVLNLLQRDAERDDPSRRNFDSLRELIARSHEDEASKRRLLQQAVVLVRSLYRAGVIHMVHDAVGRYLWVVVDAELQWDFSLHQALSLFLIEALGQLDQQSDSYAADVVSLVEAVLEDPEVVLRRQVDKLKQELVARLKADGVQYEERMERLEEIGPPRPPQPLVDFLHGAFHRFRGDHPWVGGRDIRPKLIGREMLLDYASFGDFVKRYHLERSEGVLLRYLSQLYKTLKQSVPEAARSEAVYDALGFFRALIERTDTSLLEEWEELLHPELRRERAREHEAAEALWIRELIADPKAFGARVRAEMHLLVRTLAARDWEAAAESVAGRAAAGEVEGEAITAGGGSSEDVWDAERFEREMAPFFAEYGELLFTPEARRHQFTQIERTGDRTWEVCQTLLDSQGDNLWAILGAIDLRDPHSLEGPLVRLHRIGA
jgi:superfamily II DNA/RNA helicase